MQYVNGKTLQMKIDDSSPLSLLSILRTGAQIAEGLAAAHRQGLVHRDIKPANILLENGVERVKITDFGLAYAMDDAGASQGSTAGTPVFMSPEQASGERLDQRSDLFSFGSVLYTMCAGRPPFDSGSLLSVIQKITQDAPRRVREVNPSTPEWLAAIVERLMEKKPDRRIQTASEVAAMLQSRLNDLELSTRGNALPKSSAPLRKRLAKWAMVFALAAAAVPIVIHYMHGSAGSAKQNDLMKLPPEIKPIIPLRVMSMPDSLELAKRPAAADALDRNMIPPELLDAGGWDKLTDAPPELVAILGKPIQNQYCQIFSLAVSSDGKIVAVAGVDKVIRIWDIAAGKLQKELFGHQKTGGIAVYSLAFNPEGNLLASGDELGFVKLWDIAAGREVASVNSPSDRITQLAFSPDGKLLLVCHQHGTINHWNIPAMTLHFAMKTPAEPWSVAISPDGQTWAYGDNQKVFFYDLLTGKLKGNLPYEPATVRWIGFRPDGQNMVTAAMDPQKNIM